MTTTSTQDRLRLPNQSQAWGGSCRYNVKAKLKRYTLEVIETSDFLAKSGSFLTPHPDFFRVGKIFVQIEEILNSFLDFAYTM